jgi:quinol monooxygenase YgiN
MVAIVYQKARRPGCVHAAETGRSRVKGSVSDVVVIAEAKAKPGKAAELEHALREAAGPMRAQPGCVEFTLYRRKDAPATIVGFERWASETDHQRHLRGVHVPKLMGRMADILAEPPNIVSYELLDE